MEARQVPWEAVVVETIELKIDLIAHLKHPPLPKARVVAGLGRLRESTISGTET